MPLITAVGSSKQISGRDAGWQAVENALEQVGRQSVAFGFVIASHIHPLGQVLDGVADLLGDIPMLGFSSSAELTSQGLDRRTVAVALFCGEDLRGRANWWPDFTDNSRACTQNMLQGLQPSGKDGEILLLVADGLNGDADYLCRALSDSSFALAGCLAGGDLRQGRTYQLGGRRSGGGGLAAAVLAGDIVAGVGAAHGWQPVGALARLTRVQGQWVREMDGQPANEAYERLFGYPARQWAFPPLTELVRLYPLGVQVDADIVIRSPLRMEVDGSLRMNAALVEGSTVDLMVGTQEDCILAARKATEDALVALGPTRPRLALALVDAAWQRLLELQPGAEIQAMRQVLGQDVPILGGYTFGQIARLNLGQPVDLLNQHMLVVLFGEKRIDLDM